MMQRSSSISSDTVPSAGPGKDPVLLTPEEAYFHRGLDLWTDGRAVTAAWIDWKFEGQAFLCHRRLEAGAATTRIPCDPYEPWIVRNGGNNTFFWIGFQDQRGRLLQTSADGQTRPVPNTESWDCGDLAVAIQKNKAPCLAVQVWESDRVSLQLINTEDERWTVTKLPAAASFAARPALAFAPDGGVYVAWDEYVQGKYRCAVANVHNGAVVDCSYFEQAGHQTVRPSIAMGAAGELYLAFCLERLVEIEGAVDVHSRIVTMRRDKESKSWCETGRTCIDHAMNPWLAGYDGHRRRPWLIPAEKGGAWLLFEEKIDSKAMSPGNGRLIIRDVNDGKEFVAHENKSGYVVAPRLTDDGRILVACKNQDERWVSIPRPYELVWLNLDAATNERPANLTDHGDAPPFQGKPRVFHQRPDWLDRQLFFGDPHNHSSLSGDLEGDPDEMYHQVRDTAHLDFVAFTENDYLGFTYPLPPATFEVSRRHAQFFNRPGAFTTFVAWEYTRQEALSGQGNHFADLHHRNVITDGDDLPIHSCFGDKIPTPAALVAKLRGQRLLLHHHHNSGFDITDDELERNIEIVSSWGAYMNDQESFRANVHGLLNQGLRLGFIGGSDSHTRNAGLGGALTGVWAEHNTRQSIFEALRQRRCFATTGLRPDLRLTVAGQPMGGKLPLMDRPLSMCMSGANSPCGKLRLSVTATSSMSPRMLT